MTEATEQGPVRHESFPCEGPIDLDVRMQDGRVDVELGDGPVARVTLVADPDADAKLVERMLAGTKVEWSAKSGKLVVRTPRSSRLNLLIELPERSRLSMHAGSAPIDVSGTAGRLVAHAGSGDVRAEAVDGVVSIRLGSGDVKLGPVSGALRLRSGSGRFEAASLDREARLTTGSGDIALGATCSDVVARVGSGDFRIDEARRGNVNVLSGSGDLWIGIAQGVTAEIDVVSGSGSTRSDLDVSAHPPAGGPAVRIKARTGSGEAVVARAG